MGIVHYKGIIACPSNRSRKVCSVSYYHVNIERKSSGEETTKLDFSLEQLEERVLGPYRTGRPITIRGTSIDTNDIKQVTITHTEQDSASLRPLAEQKRASSGIIRITPLEWDILKMGKDVTDSFIVASPGSEHDTELLSSEEPQPAADAKEVFIVHGRNEEARIALFTFLSSIGLQPLVWNVAVQATGKGSPYIKEILDVAFARAHAVVVLFTPDDEARLREPFQASSDPPHESELTGQARPNVLFEAGMAMARNQDRTVLVELGDLRPFSDTAGLHAVHMNNSSQRRQDLAQRLQTAGCPVNLSGIEWHTIGDFEAAVAKLSRHKRVLSNSNHPFLRTQKSRMKLKSFLMQR